MKRLSLSVFSLALAASLPAGAQDFALDEIIITANRVATGAARTGVSATTVTAEDIAQTKAQTAAAYLATLPGISLATQGPFGNTGNLRIRGADGRYLAVFIDGIRVSDPSGTTVNFDFGSLLTSDIGRIEVLRGSQSALWGGSAVGGVINITTTRAAEDGIHQSAAVEAGSYGTARLSYGVTQKDARGEVAFTATHLRTDGFSAFAGGTEADGATASRLSFSTRYAVSDALTVGGAIFAQQTDQDYDGYVAFALADVDNSQSRREAGARVFAELGAGSTDHLFEVSLFDIKRSFDQPSDSSTFKGQRLTFGYQGTTQVSDALSLVYGIDWNRETARYSNLPAGIADTRTLGAFGQVLWAPTDAIDLAATLRQDRNSGFGSFTTGRLALAYRPAQGTTIRAAYATGFRAPSVDERFGVYPGSEFVGNPALAPEESTSYELGIEQAFAGGASLSATLFRLEISNLVAFRSCPFTDPDNFDFSCQPGTISTLENVAGTSERQGLELAASLPLNERVTVGLAYTYTDATRPTGTRLAQVPRHDLTLSVDADLSDRISAGVQVKHVAGRVDNDPNTFALEAMPDYTVMNAVFSYDLTDTAQAYLRVENVADTVYQSINGYGTSRRAVYVGVAAKF